MAEINGVGPQGELNALQFLNSVQKLSDNYAAIGSRVLIFYMPDCTPAVRKCYVSPEEEAEMAAKYCALQRLASPKFTALLFNDQVRQWLEQPHPPDVAKRLVGIADDCRSDIVPKLIAGVLENYRHSRGLALRHALLNYIGDLVAGKLDIDRLLKEAEDSYRYVMKLEFDSLGNLAAVDTVGLFAVWFKEEPKYIQQILTALADVAEKRAFWAQLKIGSKKARSSVMAKRIRSTSFKKYGIEVVMLENEPAFYCDVPFDERLKGVVS